MTGGSACTLALAGLGSPADAATFTASNQTELYQAVASAQASADADSTIVLTGSFTVSNPFPSISTAKDITIDTGANTLTFATAATFDIASGAVLTFSGQVVNTNRVLDKNGAGELVLNSSGSGFTRIGLNAGHTLVNGGDEFTFGTSTGGTTAQLGVATGANAVASLTVSGAGTRLVATGTDPTDLSAGANSQSTLTIEDGAYFGARGIRVHTTGSRGLATINVTGAGSTLEGAAFVSANGTSHVHVRDGGVISISGNSSLGGVATIGYADAMVTAEVSGDGSRWESDLTLGMYRGSLSVLDGGVVSATTVNIATNPNGAVPNFNVLVSGAGSELIGSAMSLGTTGTGTLTIADDGRVVVGAGGSQLLVGGADADSNATLNIGGAEGEAAVAAGTLEASAVQLAASAVINFNHLETDYAFDIPINGSGAINQIAGRTIFTSGQLGFAGLTSVYGGYLEVNGALGGTVDVRGGVLAGTGSVGTTTNFAGGAVAPGSSGTGVLTIEGDYTSNGGALRIEAELGHDLSPTDLLVITGDSILGTGATQVFVTNLGGLGAETTGDGIKIVDVTGGGASAADAFVLSAPAIGGAYSYSLFQHGIADPADGDWYLRAAGLAPTVPIYESYPIMLLGLTELPTLQQRVGDRYWPRAEGADPAADAATGYAGPRNLWTRIEGAHRHGEGDSTTGLAYDSNRFLVQGGIDGLLAENGSGVLIGGLNAQYGRIDADISSDTGDGDNSTDSYGAGATLTWYGTNGTYVDGQASVAYLSSDLAADGIGELVDDNEGVGYAFSIEAGRRIAEGNCRSLRRRSSPTPRSISTTSRIPTARMSRLTAATA